ncbi:MAG TPA: hypothetical protein V6D15_25195 [Oculatellaceae cyanobacterium]|jgi:hypothetical protein
MTGGQDARTTYKADNGDRVATPQEYRIGTFEQLDIKPILGAAKYEVKT